MLDVWCVMSAFATDFDGQAVAQLFNHLGRSVTYQVPQSDPVTLTAIVGADRHEEIESDDGRENERIRDVTVLTDSTNTDFGGITNPHMRDKITIDGEIWQVQRVIDKSESLAKLECIYVARLEISKPNFRSGN